MPASQVHRRSIRRTLVGRLLPTSLTWFAALLMAGAAHLSVRPDEQPAAVALACIGLMAAIAGGALEVDIRRQLRLAGVGKTADALVVEYRKAFYHDDRDTIIYAFTTDAGARVEHECTVEDNFQNRVRIGSRLPVIYDPTHPTFSLPIQSLRQVEFPLRSRRAA